jgi:hypothetical protein
MDLEPLLRLRERDEATRQAELAAAAGAVEAARAALAVAHERLADLRARRRKSPGGSTVGELLAAARWSDRVAAEEKTFLEGIRAADRALIDAVRREGSAREALATAIGEREAVVKAMEARAREDARARERKAERG